MTRKATVEPEVCRLASRAIKGEPTGGKGQRRLPRRKKPGRLREKERNLRKLRTKERNLQMMMRMKKMKITIVFKSDIIAMGIHLNIATNNETATM